MPISQVLFFWLVCDTCQKTYYHEDTHINRIIQMALAENWRISRHPDGTPRSILCPECAEQAT